VPEVWLSVCWHIFLASSYTSLSGSCRNGHTLFAAVHLSPSPLRGAFDPNGPGRSLARNRCVHLVVTLPPGRHASAHVGKKAIPSTLPSPFEDPAIGGMAKTLTVV
jgi:hypothetical protein